MSNAGATNFPGLAATVPGTSTLGRLLGSGTSRFAVQIAYPIGATLGSFTLGTSTLNEAVWNDVTSDVMSVSWDRGAGAGDRPLAGQLDVVLANTIVNEQRKYSPALSTYWGPGTMVRVVCGDPTSITSVQITAITQMWNETFTAGQRFVHVTALEPLFMLVSIDDPPVAAVGAGENLNSRVDRILVAAQFPFARETNYGSALTGTQTFQGTTLTNDVLSELSLTLDSVDGQYFSTKAGKLAVVERASLYHTSAYVLGSGGNVPIKLDELTTANDDRNLLSRVSLTRANGSFSWTFSNEGIASRYHASSYSRTDLIIESDGDMAAVGNGLLNRGTQTLRPVSCTVPAKTAAYTFLMAVDLYTQVDVRDAAFVTFSAYAVCRMSHTIVPLSTSAVNWECQLEFEPSPTSLAFGGSTGGTSGSSMLTLSGDSLVTLSGDTLVWS